MWWRARSHHSTVAFCGKTSPPIESRSVSAVGYDGYRRVDYLVTLQPSAEIFTTESRRTRSFPLFSLCPPWLRGDLFVWIAADDWAVAFLPFPNISVNGYVESSLVATGDRTAGQQNDSAKISGSTCPNRKTLPVSRFTSVMTAGLKRPPSTR